MRRSPLAVFPFLVACGPSPLATNDAAVVADARPTPMVDGAVAADAAALDGPAVVTPDASPDAPLVTPSAVVQVAAGLQHTCALLESGAVLCWGSNEYGQLGYPGVPDVGLTQTPADIGAVDVGGPVTQIAAGGFHTCAILVGGAVRCWGYGANGALGYGNTETIGDDEVPAAAGDVDIGVPVVALALASDHTCALADDGTVRCWGAGGTGALGYANTSSLTAPITAGVDVGGGVTSLSANGAFGTGFTCAVVSSTAPLAECWGSAIGGRLGYGNADNVGDDETPAFVGDVSLGDPPVAIAAGAGHTCAILTTGDVRCWGEGADGRLGTAATSTIGDDEVPSSIPVVDVGGAVDELALGGAHTCARLGTAVRCWGMGAFGQLGYAATASIGDDEAPSTAGDVPVGLPVRQITAGLLHTCAVVGAGTVRCWGSGGRGQLGHGNAATIGDDETPASAGDVPLF